MNATKRVRLGRFAGLATRFAIYRTDVAIEIDERDNFEVQRRRVFFDDILLITHHRELGGWYVAVMSIATLIFGGAAIVFLTVEERSVAAVFGLFAAPFALFLLLRLILRVDVVNIFGRRTKAVLRYGFRKRFARETFDDLTERTRAAQQRLADEIAAAMPAAPVEELPEMPPAEETVDGEPRAE
jgi:hypothetical protein